VPGLAPMATDERRLLLGYLAQQRNGLRYAAYGLTDEQARLAPTASRLGIGGLLKHVTIGERAWMDTVRGQRRTDAEAVAEYQAAFTMRADETLSELLERNAEVAAETEALVASLPLDHPVPVPRGVPWFPDDVEHWSLRWVLLHLIEELARHAGHADLIRETIDGATMYELVAGAEGWPATDWITPWRPPS